MILNWSQSPWVTVKEHGCVATGKGHTPISSSACTHFFREWCHFKITWIEWWIFWFSLSISERPFSLKLPSSWARYSDLPQPPHKILEFAQIWQKISRRWGSSLFGTQAGTSFFQCSFRLFQVFDHKERSWRVQKYSQTSSPISSIWSSFLLIDSEVVL